MTCMRKGWCLTGVFLTTALALAEVKLANERVFTGMCDASAGVAIDGDRFLRRRR